MSTRDLLFQWRYEGYLAVSICGILYFKLNGIEIPKKHKTDLWLSRIFPFRKCLSGYWYLGIDSEGRLRTKLYDKRDNFNFPIVNFPFIFSNIPAAPAYGVYISFQRNIKQTYDCPGFFPFVSVFRGIGRVAKWIVNTMYLIPLSNSLCNVTYTQKKYC
jgi:hypothetical protein